MAVSGGLVAASHPLDSLRDPFQARLSQALGGDVRFGGIAPHGLQGFRLTDLSMDIPLENGEWGRFRVPSAVIQLSPVDLLQGRQAIHVIEIDGALFDVNLDGVSGQTAEQLPGIMQAFLETPGLSVRGRNGAMRVYSRPGVPPLMLTNVEFDFQRPDGEEAVSGRFHAQLGNTPAERLDAHFHVDSRRRLDVVMRGNRLSSRTITRVFPAASEYLLAGAFYPEVRMTCFKDRWFMMGRGTFEGVDVFTRRHGAVLGDGTFQAAAAYSRDSRELVIGHARLDSSHLRGSARGTIRFMDGEPEIALEIEEIEFPSPLRLEQLALEQPGTVARQAELGIGRFPYVPRIGFPEIAGSH